MMPAEAQAVARRFLRVSILVVLDWTMMRLLGHSGWGRAKVSILVVLDWTMMLLRLLQHPMLPTVSILVVLDWTMMPGN